MGVFYLVSGPGALEVSVEDGGSRSVAEGFRGTFARRYIPSFTIEAAAPGGARVGARILWRLVDQGFRVKSYRLGRGGGVDVYEVYSAPPAPYINESPYFFILQVLARQYARQGMIAFTDAVSFTTPDMDRAYLLLGYPHTGKSTMTALALERGFIPLTTENTIVEMSGGRARVIGGTSVLVYDPAITGIYGIKIPVHERTRHGYHVVDLDRVRPERAEALSRGIPVDRIYVLHCSFSSRGADYKPVRGRKIVKTLWYFATALIKGVDYYEPAPLDLSVDTEVMESIAGRVRSMARAYEEGFYEVYGRHDEAFQLIAGERQL